jgi:cytochrome c oxidase assembly protein subunit 15
MGEERVDTDTNESKAAISRGHLALLLAATAMTYLLIILGGVVCITDASQACPDWPGCYGRAVPPPEVKAITEYTHRVVAALTTPLIVAAAFVGWRRARGLRWVSRPPLAAIVFVLAVIVFGALVVLRGLSRGAAALDLGSALTVLALMVTASVVAGAHRQRPELPDRLAWGTPLARLSLVALGAVFATLVSGVLVAEPGSAVRCLGWPQVAVSGDPHRLRAVLGGTASLLVLVTVVWALARAVRTRHDAPEGRLLAVLAVAVGLVLVAEAALVWLVLPAVPEATATGWLILSAALATTLWAGMVAVAVLAALPEAG